MEGWIGLVSSCLRRSQRVTWLLVLSLVVITSVCYACVTKVAGRNLVSVGCYIGIGDDALVQKVVK